MRKRMVFILICVTMFAITGCGGDKEETVDTQPVTKESESFKSESNEKTVINDTLSSILEDITNDFNSTITYLTEELQKVDANIGDSYDGYVANKQLLMDWYTLARSESDGLFKSSLSKSKDYYKEIVTSVDHEDSHTINSAMSEFFDAIYSDSFTNYFDAIYDVAFVGIFDKYYDGVITDAYDTVDYNEWQETHSECYSQWSDARSEIYSIWSDARSDLYSDWSDVSSDFWKGNFDVDSILKDDEEDTTESKINNTDSTEEISEHEKETSANVPEDTESKSQVSVSGIRPEFKEAMDSYEAFFDEYAEFMKKYSESSNPVGLLSDFNDYMQRYTETMEKLDAIDQNELSAEEALYFSEVSTRISRKLLEATQ